MRFAKIGLILGCALLQLNVAAQKQNIHEAHVWIGYITQLKLSSKWSLWNDAHFNTESFFLVRHGLSYSPIKNTTLTGGYAWANLTTPQSTSLKRKEHRPWAQIVFSNPLEQGWSVQNRIRYDARFRQKIVSGALTDGFVFNNRIRYQFNIRKSINGSVLKGGKAFLSLNEEILVNFGKNVMGNHLDQNRLSCLYGVNKGNHSYQIGYMHRFIPPTSGVTQKHFHTVALWVNSNFETKKYKQRKAY